MTGPSRKIRNMQDGDLAFVHDSWRRSFRDYRLEPRPRCNPSQNWVLDRVYWSEMTRRIYRLLNKARVLVACGTHNEFGAKDESQIFGWLCYEPRILHYVYVKDIYRRQGIARELIAAAPVGDYVVTHWTQMLNKIGKPLRYNPGALKEGPCDELEEEWSRWREKRQDDAHAKT